MGVLKWIGGVLGWALFGPIGILIGAVLGSLADENLTKAIGGPDDFSNPQSGNKYGSGSANGRQGQRGSRTANSDTEQRNSFLVSLLVLSSAVIRADGRTLQSELDYVRNFIRRNFGESAVNEAMSILSALNNQTVNIYEVGPQIRTYMNYSQRLQLFHYLAQLANADGDFCREEKVVLESIATAIGLTASDMNSIISMFYRDSANAYTVLELDKSASDDEVRKAYRRMAMKYHPDKVATLGPDVQKAAEEKFRKIQEAYETIKKERGIA